MGTGLRRSLPRQSDTHPSRGVSPFARKSGMSPFLAEVAQYGGLQPFAEAPRKLERILDLEAARFAVQAPLAEMLTVVSPDAVAILTQARARAVDHIIR